MNQIDFTSTAINFPSNSVYIDVPEQLVPGHTYKVKLEFTNQDPVEFENICQIYDDVNGNGIAYVIMGNPNYDIENHTYNPEFVILYNYNNAMLFANYSNLNVMVTISEIRPLGKISVQEFSEIYSFDGNELNKGTLIDVMNMFSQQMNLGISFFPTEPIISADGGSMAW